MTPADRKAQFVAAVQEAQAETIRLAWIPEAGQPHRVRPSTATMPKVTPANHDNALPARPGR